MSGRFAVKAMSTSSCSTTKRGALIFLHGLGDSPAGWSSLEHSLPSLNPSLKQSEVAYVFPPSPTIGLTINGGMRMPGWFDLYDWPIGVGAKDDPEGMRAAVAQVHAQVERLESEHGLKRNQIVLGGFSQGAAIALLATYHLNNHKSKNEDNEDAPLAFAGCACLSGWLTMTDDLKEMADTNIASKTPLFWAHGKYDDKVLFEQQADGIERLTSVGTLTAPITSLQYPMGHESDPQEIQALAKFLDQVLPPL
jgi:lysophospholipase-2